MIATRDLSIGTLNGLPRNKNGVATTIQRVARMYVMIVSLAMQIEPGGPDGLPGRRGGVASVLREVAGHRSVRRKRSRQSRTSIRPT